MSKWRRTYLPWVAWFVASLATCFTFILQSSSSVMIEGLRASFAIDYFQVSVLSSTFFYAYLILQIPSGMLTDKISPRYTLFVCQFCVAFMCLAYALSTSLLTAGLSRILMGMFAAPAIISALFIASRRLPKGYFVLAAGLTETIALLGGFIGEVVISRTVVVFGWRFTMLILSCVAMVLMFLVFMLVSDKARSKQAEPEQAGNTHVLSDFFHIISMPQAWLNGMYSGLMFMWVSAFGAYWSVPYLMKLYGITVSQAADASACIFIGAAVGTPIIGLIATRLKGGRNCMLIYSLVAIILSVAIIYVPVSYQQIRILIFLLGFFCSAYLLPFDVMRNITPPGMRGTVIGYTNMMCILIGAPIMQPLIGWLLPIGQDISVEAYRQAFSLLPMGMLATLVIAYFIKEKLPNS